MQLNEPFHQGEPGIVSQIHLFLSSYSFIMLNLFSPREGELSQFPFMYKYKSS